MNSFPSLHSKTVLFFLTLVLKTTLGLSEVSTQTKTFNQKDLVTQDSNQSEKNQTYTILFGGQNYSKAQGKSIKENFMDADGSKKDKAPKWKVFKNDIGAFSVNLPDDPKDISKESPNPLDEDGDPYKIHMYSSIDEKNESFYLVRYNDMPNGYYLKDREAGFNSIQENLEGKAVMLAEPKVIKLGDAEGREVEVLVKGNYHAIMRVYIRGNRIYVLMAQKLNTTDKIARNDEFFKSFKFEPYAKAEPVTFQPKEDEFKIRLFGNVKTTIDTVGFESSRVKQTTNYYSVNPTSGGLYQINSGALQDYVQIRDLNEFYDEHITLYMEWNDTIMSQKELKVDGKQGMEYMLENMDSKIKERYQIWLDNDLLFVMTAYLSEEERKHPISDLIFNSFEYDSSKKPKFDRLSSKSELMLKDLHSLDSLKLERAYGAFDYYKFEESDLPKLYKALQDTYKDSLYTQVIRQTLISVFPSTHNQGTVETLKSLYLDTFKNDEELKSAIISTIPSIKEENAYPIYKELLKQSPPTSSEDYSWQILAPFRDSIPFATENFKLLTSLMDHELYRYSILNISSDLAQQGSETKQLVLNEQGNLLKFAKKDLELYKNSLTDTIVSQFEYSGLMYAYLNFMNATGLNSASTDEFTSSVINMEDNEWYKTQAITARIKSGQTINKELTNSLMDSLDYRFEIMKAYFDTNQFQNVAEKHKKAESFAVLSLHYHLSEDDYEPESMQMMGELTKNDQVYYAYKVKYDEGEGSLTSYLVTVGPINDVTKMTDFQLYDIYSDWEQVDIAKWESQAENLIPDTSKSED